MDDYRPIPKLE